MENLNFRPLKENEIECRVGSTTSSGFFLLLYKNARVDANILDETFGVFNWQKRFYQVKNTMVCEILINANYKNPELEPRWIAKADGGDDDTQMEQVKSELSDSFKRAAFCVGIGRELYYSPKIFIKTSDDNTTKAYYSVKQITYKADKHIERLVIINNKTKKVVFTYDAKENVAENGENEPKNNEPMPKPTPNEPVGSIEPHDLALLQNYVEYFTNETSKENFFKWLNKHFNTMSLAKLTKSQAKAVVKKLDLEN